ncbi:hypothetical protein [Acetivibrio clariflavus]|uniref:Sporulation membrane protein YtrI C-terminal domain-containing protein n=1 Tax=Acetivibrio clariflavus (strain DSM 19732 / NBRC 101661 / EBR45) TaxID=720554 RepID=G8LXP9_ACECE|nr:hypothetical protein [Acetivibrio clariflavus]AEV67760.1 hypothetical protein Clocl_1085 [Acetivibrio clariflavus DSM 19732]
MKKIKSFKFLIIFVTGFICGFVFGSSAINALISYRVDAYIEKIKYLESDIEEKNIKLEKYQESINNRKFILRSIELNIKLSKINEEEFDLILVEKSIKEKYKELLGKEVKSIDIDLVAEVIDKRILKIDGKEYQLKVDKILLSDILKLWITIVPIEG